MSLCAAWSKRLPELVGAIAGEARFDARQAQGPLRLVECVEDRCSDSPTSFHEKPGIDRVAVDVASGRCDSGSLRVNASCPSPFRDRHPPDVATVRRPVGVPGSPILRRPLPAETACPGTGRVTAAGSCPPRRIRTPIPGRGVRTGTRFLRCRGRAQPECRPRRRRPRHSDSSRQTRGGRPLDRGTIGRCGVRGRSAPGRPTR